VCVDCVWSGFMYQIYSAWYRIWHEDYHKLKFK
jgi:hypothetical protein